MIHQQRGNAKSGGLHLVERRRDSGGPRRDGGGGRCIASQGPSLRSGRRFGAPLALPPTVPRLCRPERSEGPCLPYSVAPSVLPRALAGTPHHRPERSEGPCLPYSVAPSVSSAGLSLTASLHHPERSEGPCLPYSAAPSISGAGLSLAARVASLRGERFPCQYPLYGVTDLFRRERLGQEGDRLAVFAARPPVLGESGHIECPDAGVFRP